MGKIKAKEPATSPRKGDSKAQEMLEQAQSLIDNFEDQKTMKIEQTDEQKSEEIAKTYESVQQFVKGSVMVYGCQASVNTVEQQIGKVFYKNKLFQIVKNHSKNVCLRRAHLLKMRKKCRRSILFSRRRKPTSKLSKKHQKR